MDWQRTEPTKVTQVGWRTIVSKTFLLPDGKTAEFDIVCSEGYAAAAIIALTKDNKVIIARQFRPGPEQMMNEIPGGVVDEGEDPETSARRELLEETGYQAGELKPIGVFYRDSYLNSKFYYYIARNCRRVVDTPESGEHEFIEVRLQTIPEFINDSKKGLMTDPFAVLAAYDDLIEISKEEIKE